MELFFKDKYRFWFILSIITAILFSFSGLKIALRSSNIIQDDARQYIFWMQQFNDNGLWQNDLIANYFKSVTPTGFTNLYKLASSLGIDVFFFNKISTLIIGITTTIYCFLVCLEIFPVPFAGFISSLLLNQNLWMVDDLSSGTPRAFIYVLLLAFIYYLLRQNILLCLLVIIVQGLFYPQAVLISVTVLILRLLENKRLNKIELWGIFFGTVILLFYSLKTSDFSPVITATQAQLLPEFLPEGRSAFFLSSFSEFWLTSRRSGFFPVEWQYSLMCAYGISLWWLKEYSDRFPLVKQLKPTIYVLLELLLASILLFLLAHLLLFRLHLPGRYTHHTIRIIIALVDGITIAIIFNKLVTWITKICHKEVLSSRNRGIITWISSKSLYVPFSKVNSIPTIKFVLIIPLLLALLYPTYAVQSYPERLGYVTGESPAMYRFLQQQSKDILIATLSKESNFIPSLAARSVLAAEEYAIPYHRGYYEQISQRVADLITAQYSSDRETLIKFFTKYQIDLLLIDKNAFTIEYLIKDPWLQQFQPETDRAIKQLNEGQKPFLLQYGDLAKGKELHDRCTIFQDKNNTLIDTNCLQQK